VKEGSLFRRIRGLSLHPSEACHRIGGMYVVPRVEDISDRCPYEVPYEGAAEPYPRLTGNILALSLSLVLVIVVFIFLLASNSEEWRLKSVHYHLKLSTTTCPMMSH
jgi:hypothetical protein